MIEIFLVYKFTLKIFKEIVYIISQYIKIYVALVEKQKKYLFIITNFPNKLKKKKKKHPSYVKLIIEKKRLILYLKPHHNTEQCCHTIKLLLII